jgi:amino acid transporter
MPTGITVMLELDLNVPPFRQTLQIKMKRDREAILRDDAETLHKLGYAQELFREMGGFSNFAVSFSVISILTGAVLLYGYGLKYGGPFINTVGWPLVSLFVLCVAASMAEIASAYPTAGGLYYWAFRLGGREWAWSCAWLNLIGQITVTAGVDIGAATYTTGLVTNALGIPAGATVPVLGAINGWSFWLAVMVLLMIPQVIINIRGLKTVSRLSDLSVTWHIGGVVILAALLTFAGKYHEGWHFLLSTEHPALNVDVMTRFAIGPWSVPSIVMMIPGVRYLYMHGASVYAFGFMLGLLQAQWTYTGYDASAHMAEETFMARMNSAWGIFLSVAVSAIVGYVLLMALTNAIPPGKLAETVADPYPVLYIVRNSLTPFFTNLIAVIIAVAMWLCGLASVTSMARVCYAFGRDAGMPGASFLSRVSKWRTPANAIVVTSTLVVLVTAYSATYAVVTSMSTAALYLAYIIPVCLNARNKWRGMGEFTTAESAPWSLGRFGPFINLIAIAWVAFITILFSIPPNELAGITIVMLIGALFLYWQISQKHRFRGPRAANVDEIEQAEARLIAAQG